LGIRDALALSTNVKLSKDCDLFQRSDFSSKKWGNEPWNSTSKSYRFYLVGGFEHEWIMTFRSVGNVIIPTDKLFHIFQRGRLKPPTRYALTIFNQHEDGDLM
jgi:hypothetical protein